MMVTTCQGAGGWADRWWRSEPVVHGSVNHAWPSAELEQRLMLGLGFWPWS